MEARRAPQLGKYQLVAEIARGGMGIVYLAIASGPARFSKLLVVKELKPELAEDPAFTEMFLEEARLAARLSHPNIVQTYEVGEDEGRQYMVMDYLEGVTLARVLRRSSDSFTPALHMRVICELLEGLQYAHELKDFDGTPLGLVHRDVSPQNVFITYDGQAKLVDFGIAKAIDSAVETRIGTLKGKPSYMAPEQMQGRVDPRADLYSVGVMLWEAAAGRRMWHRKSDMEVLASLVHGNLPSLREAAPEVSPELERIIVRALAREPGDRYQTARELHEELDAYLTASGQVATARDAGKVTAELFATERENARATIEHHLQLAREGQTGERVPSIRPPRMDGSTPSMRILGEASEPSVTSSVSSFGSLTQQQVPSASQRTPPALAEIPVHVDLTAREQWVKRRPLVLGLLLLCGAAAGVLWFSFSKQPAATMSAPPPATSVATNERASAPLPSPSATPIASVVPVAAADAPTASGALDASTITSSPTAARDKRVGYVHPVTNARSKVERPSDTTPPAPDTGSEAVAAAPAAASGFLTLDTLPWTHVSIGGRALGDTPLVHVQVPSGTHTLSLDNPDEGIHRTTVVTVKSGESVSRRLAF